MAATTVKLGSDGYQASISTRQHLYFADEPLEDGGTDIMVTPTEMLMGALGACMAMTCKMYAQRKGWPLESVEVTLDFERFNSRDYSAYEGPAPYVHEVRENFTFHGDLTDEQRTRLLEIAAICPVSRVLDSPTFFARHLETDPGEA